MEADSTFELSFGAGEPSLYAVLSSSVNIDGNQSNELDFGAVRVTDDTGGAGCQDRLQLDIANDRDFLSIRILLWAGSNPCPTLFTSTDLPTAISISDFNVATTIQLNLENQQSFFGTVTNVHVTSSATLFPVSCNGGGGDQLGCTNCPCGNNAFQLTVGGCVNSTAQSARLAPSGSSSIAAADLRFEASGAPVASTAVLTSGNALAPANAANPCFGLNSGVQAMQLDGLRCVVQGVLRHGVRPADANGDIGISTNGWGTPNGFFNFNAFSAGQTKHFQMIYRDDESQVCMRGQNTSQAVSVTFGS